MVPAGRASGVGLRQEGAQLTVGTRGEGPPSAPLAGLMGGRGQEAHIAILRNILEASSSVREMTHQENLGHKDS